VIRKAQLTFQFRRAKNLYIMMIPAEIGNQCPLLGIIGKYMRLQKQKPSMGAWE
jgi:hypothetical protein